MHPTTAAYLQQHPHRTTFVQSVLSRQRGLYDQGVDLTPVYDRVAPILGPFDINSEGTTRWLALCQALQDACQMTAAELQAALARGTVRK